MSEDFDGEPIPGLPQRPPSGETILWQGSPDLRATLLRTFHVRKIAVYFLLLCAWAMLDGLFDGRTAAEAAAGLLRLVPLALLALGLLAGLARVVSRSTVYTVTTQRVVMRFGIALPMAVNLPFRLVAGASVKAWPDGTGNIPLQLRREARVGYVVMWPHVRPWHLARPQPMMRGIPDVQKVAALLARALVEADPNLAAQSAEVQERARQSAGRDQDRDQADSHPGVNSATAAA